MSNKSFPQKIRSGPAEHQPHRVTAWILLVCVAQIMFLLLGCDGTEQQSLIETVLVTEVITNTPMPTPSAPPTPKVTATPRPTPTPEKPRILTIGLVHEPDSLYVHGSTMGASFTVRQAFLDGPIDFLSYEYRPVILESLPSLENGGATLNEVTVAKGEAYCDEGIVDTADQSMELEQLVVTFRLKEGLLWEDGTPLTAYDSAFGWQVYCDEETPNRDEVLCEQTTSYEASDDLTAIWTGVPGCLNVTYLTSFAIPLPEHILGNLVKSRGAGAIVDDDYARHPIGWGPFKIEEWQPGLHIHLVRNENYFRADEGLPYLDEVYFIFASGTNQLAAQLQAGQVDLIPSVSTNVSIYDENYFTYWDAIFQLGDEDGIQIHATPTNIWEHLDFNLQPIDDRYVFFDDLLVRQAIAYGIDRQRMVDELTYGRGALIHGLVPAEHPLAAPQDTLTIYEYDPDRARQLLEAAGWTPGNDGYYCKGKQKLSVTLYAAGGSFRGQLILILEENMEAIGIEVKVVYLTASDFYASGPEGALFGRRFDLAEFAWANMSPDPLCSLYLSSNIPSESGDWWDTNVTGYSNAEFDAACNAALGTLAADERATNFSTAEQLFTQDLPSLILFLRSKVVLSRSKVRNLVLDPTEGSDIWNIEQLDIEQ